MDTINWKQESILLLLVILPLAYLASVWNTLPETVPIHFNAKGEADGWGSKNTLIYLSLGLGFGIYLLMTVIPIIDPKQKLQKMGSKYFSLKFIMVLFMTLLACYIIYTAQVGEVNSNGLFALIGLMFAALGNYFQSIKHNYFVGIRTPWTLESENVWKKTHRLGGRIWVGGGILLAITPFLISNMDYFMPIFITIITIITAIPVIYSYLEFKKEKRGE